MPSKIADRDGLLFDVHYGHWYNLKCERLYRHLDVTLSLVQLIGGSASGLAVLSQSGVLLSVAGVLLATASALSLVVQPGVKVERHCRAKQAYTRLMASADSTDIEHLAQQLASVRADAPTGPKFLEDPAYNATLRSMGYETGFISIGRFQRALSAIA